MCVYLDDIFVYSGTLEGHQALLHEVLHVLNKAQLYLLGKRFDIYVDQMECLGHIIDAKGIHTDADKMAVVHSGPTPWNVLDIQQFLGLVQYLAAFMLDVLAYTTLISYVMA
jgi:hypothetical protein